MLESIDGDYLLASGSLPCGVPTDFYAQGAAVAARKGMKFVLDTSGEALRKAAGKGLYLMKPSLGELEDLVGRKLPTPLDQDAAVRNLIASGAAEIIALWLGRDGALLATRDTLLRIEGVKVTPKSAVGAGDSFLGSMTLGLAQGRFVEEAFTLGMAAGAGAVLTVGTELCRRADVERLYEEIVRGQAKAGA